MIARKNFWQGLGLPSVVSPGEVEDATGLAGELLSGGAWGLQVVEEVKGLGLGPIV